MTKEELISQINAEIEQLEQKKKSNDSLLRNFTTFTNKYKGIVTSDFDTINLYEFAVCYFLTKNNDFTYEEVKELLIPVKELFHITDSSEISTLCENIVKIIYLNEANLLKSNIISIDQFEEVKKNTPYKKEVCNYIENTIIEIQKIIDDNHLDKQMILKLIDLFKKYGYELCNIKQIVEIIKVINQVNNILMNFPGIAEDEEYKKIVIGKMQKRIQFIYEQFNAIFNYTEKLKRKEYSRIARIDKKEQPLKEFLDAFQMPTNAEITNFKEMIDKIPEYLRLDALKLMYLHNERIYSIIDEKYTELNNNKKLRYKSLLSSYNINYISYSLLEIPYENLAKSLQLLKKFGIDNNTIIYILENSSLSIIEKINIYLERNIINKKFIKNNYLILLPSIEHNNLTININSLEKENINPNSFITSSKILLMDNTLFSNNIEVLKKYNLLNSMKTTTNYNFLKNQNVIDIIDKLLELGMEKFLEENLGLLNNKNLDRLYILKALNIKINSMEELLYYLNLKNFYVNDEDVFKYLHQGTVSISDDEGTVDLNNFQSTERTINIDGVIFSKNKVKRNLKTNSLKDTKEALFKDIILTDEEIEIVINALEDKKIHTYK